MVETNNEVTWYYCFTELCNDAPWWMKFATIFSPKWCGHVLCFSQAGPHILFVEPCPSQLKLDIKYDSKPLDADSAALVLIEEGYTVLRSTHQFNYPRLSLIPSCVTIVKTVSGYRTPAFTPYGLYKALKWRNEHHE